MGTSAELEAVAVQTGKELVALEHDLWSLQESEEFQAWCRDCENPNGPVEMGLWSRPEARLSPYRQRHDTHPEPQDLPNWVTVAQAEDALARSDSVRPVNCDADETCRHNGNDVYTCVPDD